MSGPLARRLALWSTALLLAVAPLGTARAGNDGGALTGHLLVRNTKSPDLGGALLADLWFVDGALRVGGALGMGFLGGEDDDARVFAPVGASIAVSAAPAPLGFSLRLRAGGWSGATNEGFSGGGWLAAAFHIEYALHKRVAVSAGMDAWFLFGRGAATVFAPGASLVWVPGER